MPSTKKPDFSPNMISLDALDSWTVLDVLNQVRKAGYYGDPFRPILFYRIALRKEMEKYKAKGDERTNAKYLAAEKALRASEYDRSLLRFILDNKNQEKSTPTSSDSPATTSNPPGRRGLRASAPRPKNRSISVHKSAGGYKPAPYHPPKKTIIKGFISKEPAAALPLWEQPYLLGPAGNYTTPIVNKRKQEGEEGEGEEVMSENERRLTKVVKRAGWLF